MAENTAEAQEAPVDGVDVGEAELNEVAATAPGGPAGQIDIVMDSMIPISAGLGQGKMQIREILQLVPGSVVKLDRAVGEPIDLYLRGIPFAVGQIVVVGENLAVKITEIRQAEVGADAE